MEKCEYLEKMGEEDWKKIRRKCTVTKQSKWNNPRIVPDMDTCLNKCRNMNCQAYFKAQNFVAGIKQAVSKGTIRILEE